MSGFPRVSSGVRSIPALTASPYSWFEGRMLRAVIICTDSELTGLIEEQVSSSSLIGIARKLTEYPTMVDLTRFLRAAAPNVVFLGMQNPARAVETAERIEAQAPGTQVI